MQKQQQVEQNHEYAGNEIKRKGRRAKNIIALQLKNLPEQPNYYGEWDRALRRVEQD